MRILLYALGITFIPLPAFQHFIWPVKNCVLADICNHTWIPECGAENLTSYMDYRLFIDECDMYEYNCDYERSYEIVSYKTCFNRPATGCPTLPSNNGFFRMGNYRFVLDGKKLVYDPTESTTWRAPPPGLPSRMLVGKRRYTIESRKRNYNYLRFGVKPPCGGCSQYMRASETVKKKTFKRKTKTIKKSLAMSKGSINIFTTEAMSKILPSRFNVVYKKLTLMKDGKVMVKVVKGTAETKTANLSETVKEDSNFLE